MLATEPPSSLIQHPNSGGQTDLDMSTQKSCGQQEFFHFQLNILLAIGWDYLICNRLGLWKYLTCNLLGLSYLQLAGIILLAIGWDYLTCNWLGLWANFPYPIGSVQCSKRWKIGSVMAITHGEE